MLQYIFSKEKKKREKTQTEPLELLLNKNNTFIQTSWHGFPERCLKKDGAK